MAFKKVGILQKGLSMDPAYPRHEVLIDTTLPDNLKEQPVYIYEPVFIPKYIANWLNELKYFYESRTKELTLKTDLLGYIFDSENFINFPDDDVQKWLQETPNCGETIVEAILYGYVVTL